MLYPLHTNAVQRQIKNYISDVLEADKQNKAAFPPWWMWIKWVQ
jgi:hypothetical protein